MPPKPMAVGFVLIGATPGEELKVYKALQKVPEITELYPLFGEFDFIAKVESSDFDALGAVIIRGVRSIEGIVSTKTLTGTKLEA